MQMSISQHLLTQTLQLWVHYITCYKIGVLLCKLRS